MNGITSTNLCILVLVLLLSACSQTEQQIVTQTEPPTTEPLEPLIVPIELIMTIICVESAGNPNAEYVGNFGLMQMRLRTAKITDGNKNFVLKT
ncbi:MAG: hypothetical protein ACJAVV_002900 [Alphaproteobacteria bacterium]|jgi:hypothetical protein